MLNREWRSLALTIAASLGFGSSAQAQPTFPKPPRYVPSEAERTDITAKSDQLAAALAKISPPSPRDLLDDVAIFLKAGRRPLQLGEFFDKKDVSTILAVLDRGLVRARSLSENAAPPWTLARGSIARGFLSKVDGSPQPYAVIVPETLKFSRENRARLDVVLHGRDQTITEARFLARFDNKPAPPGSEGKITLHVFGRGNNAYRWAGETDVFEAIEAVKRNYPIDDRRIVLRGFSMGGAGAWHLGLHHPALWSSVEAGAGFTETKLYAKLKDLPPYQEKLLHIYDAADIALNAWNVPIAAYAGQNDPQSQASTNIIKALEALGVSFKTEGLLTRSQEPDFLRVLGANTAHSVDPPSAKILSAFHDAHAVSGLNLSPKRIRFAAYTVKYGKAAWLSIEQLREHYLRAEVDAEIQGSKVVVHKAENVAVLAVDRHAGETIVLNGQEFPLEPAVQGLLANVYFRFLPVEGWRILDYKQSRAFEENTDHTKRRGLQGPIDDAFTSSFLCVRGTATPWSPAVDRWSSARLDRFIDDWSLWMRGDLRVKNDTEVTPDDIETHNLILFGDPGSNRLIARVLPDLPLAWTRHELTLAGNHFTAADHAPALIAPNPLNPRRYVVLNSGHTFTTADFNGTNALLYPRLADHAVFQTDGRNATLKASGFFDEGWSLRNRE